MRIRTAAAGFSLVEVLCVVLIIGIFTGSGVGYYTKMTQETQMATFRESLSAFLAACHERARSRGFSVRCQRTARGLQAEGSAALFCPLPQCSSKTEAGLESLVFTSSQTLSLGKPVTRLPLEFILAGRPATLTLELPQ